MLPFLAKMHVGHDAGSSAAADACTRPSRGVGAGWVLIITRIKVESSSRLITVHLNQAFTRRENSHVAGSKHEARLPTTPHTRGQVRWTGRSCPPPSLDLRSRHTARRAPPDPLLPSVSRLGRTRLRLRHRLHPLPSSILELDIRSQVASQLRLPLPLERSPCSLSGPRRRSNNNNDSDSEGWRWEALQQTSESCLGISQAARWTSSRSSHGRHHHRGSRGQRAARLTSSRSSRRRRPCRGS